MAIEVTIVSLRSGDESTGLGRHQTLHQLRSGLPRIGCSPAWLSVRQPSLRALGFARGALRWMLAALRGRVLPLQSLLALQGWLDAPRPAGAEERDASSIIYIDGVRMAFCGPALRRRLGGRLLVDFDDLMSRRVRRLERAQEPLALGAFAGILPPGLARLLQHGPLVGWLSGIEKRLLRRAEIRAAREADAIAFTSAFEARLFQRFLRRYAGARAGRPKCLVLGPSIGGTLPDPREIALRPPPERVRYVFIGSDVLEQNRVAVQAILDLAREGALAAPVHLYGRMVRSYAPIAGVTFHGFAESLDEVYQPGSILFIPRSVRGGIKSKILEACEHGVPTLGVASALEGFEGDLPWRLPPEQLLRIAGDAAALRDSYQAALAAMVETCRRQFTSARYWSVLETYAHAAMPSGPAEDAGRVPILEGAA